MPRAAELEVHVSYDGRAVDTGIGQTEARLGRFEGFTSKLSGTIAGLATGLSVGLAGSLTAITAATMSIEDALMPIGTLVGTGSQQFGELSAGIKEVIKNSPASPDDIGKSAYAILSAGISDTGAAMEALQQSVKLSQAGLGSTAEATDLVTSAMNSFKGENLSAQKAAETFFGTIASGKTTTTDLAQGFGGIAPLAASAGVQFTDLMAATAAITSTGANASEAYTGLKGVISGLIKPTAEAAETAEKLGLDFSTARVKAIGLPAFLDEVKAASGGNIETMGKLFGSVEGLNAVLALTGPQAEAFKGNLTNIANAGGNLEARAKETEQTVSARYAILKNKVTVALSDLGQKGFVQLFGFLDRNKGTFKAFADEAKTAFTIFTEAFKAGSNNDLGIGGPGNIRTIMGEVGMKVRQTVDLVREYWPKIREVMGTVADYVRYEVWPRMLTVWEGVAFAVGYVVDFVREHWPEISGVIQQVGEVIGSALEAMTALFDTTVTIIRDIWRRFGGNITSVIEGVWDVVLPLVQGALGILKGLFDAFGSALKGDWSGVWDGLKDAFSSAWDGIYKAVTGALDGLFRAISAVFDGVRDKSRDTWMALVRIIVGALNEVIDAYNVVARIVPGLPEVGRIPMPGGTGGPAGTSTGGGAPPEFFNAPVLPGMAAFRSAGGMTIETVNVQMPQGSNGPDVVRALRDFQRRNGAIPIAVTGRI